MTENSDPTGNSDSPSELIKLGTYEWPRGETQQTLSHVLEKIKDNFFSDATSDAVDDKQLKFFSDEALKTAAQEELAKKLCELLDRQYLEWAQSSDTSTLRRAFIHPPMADNLLRNWADQHDFQILDHAGTIDQFGNKDVIVVPKLEVFFKRDYGQLKPLFDLLNDLTQRDGKVIVGCNSWAWRFLAQFDDAHLTFSSTETFPAFDSDALAVILQNALNETDNEKTFASAASGDPILQRDDDGALKDPYLNKLANLSLGHPWVAIEMFFQGIAEVEDTEEESLEDKTWVKLPASCSLPPSGADALLFALHVLMIQGARPVEELNELLPDRVPNGTWAELVRLGFVELIDGHAQCVIRNYPSIRSELAAAGFNLDDL